MLLTPASRMSSSAGSFLKSAIFLYPILFTFSTPIFSASAMVFHPLLPSTEPLEPMAWAMRPRLRGEAMSALTEIEPADSPMMVMREGSPPKAAMLSFTHWMAATWSRKP